MSKYDALRERALCNAESLFDYWGLDYVKINEKEYDFINPTRKDYSHGACRFNIDKGRGADFAGSFITDDQINEFGTGFTREDFVNIGKSEQAWGFDIIGLCQRFFQQSHKLETYGDAAKFLQNELRQLNKKIKLIKPSKDATEQREYRNNTEKLKRLQSAEKIWRVCRSFEGTLGDYYLRNRKIYIRDELAIRFHSKIYNSELKQFIPALVFNVSKMPSGHLEAIHRIYLDKDGTKLKVTTPKAALGSVQGSAIWFGKPGEQLCIAEGPENALSIRCLGYSFVCSSVFSNNFSNLTIPHYVKELILFPDGDPAGKANVIKAVDKYRIYKPKIVFPPNKEINNKQVDWNDVIMGKTL